eukprot:3219530-Amphidinium_carterae.1
MRLELRPGPQVAWPRSLSWSAIRDKSRCWDSVSFASFTQAAEELQEEALNLAKAGSCSMRGLYCKQEIA